MESKRLTQSQGSLRNHRTALGDRLVSSTVHAQIGNGQAGNTDGASSTRVGETPFYPQGSHQVPQIASGGRRTSFSGRVQSESTAAGSQVLGLGQSGGHSGRVHVPLGTRPKQTVQLPQFNPAAANFVPQFRTSAIQPNNQSAIGSRQSNCSNVPFERRWEREEQLLNGSQREGVANGLGSRPSPVLVNQIDGQIDRLTETMARMLNRAVANINDSNQEFRQEIRGELDARLQHHHYETPARPTPPINQLDRQNANAYQQLSNHSLPPVMNNDTIGRSIVSNITKYDGVNYEQWSEEVYRMFVLDGKEHHLDGNMLDGQPPDVQREDLRLASFLEGLIDAKYKKLVRKDGQAAFHIWSALKAMHGHESKIRTEAAILRFVRNAQSGVKTSLPGYLDTQMALVYDLMRREATTDDFVSAILLSGLPSSMAHLKAQAKLQEGTCEDKVLMLRKMHDNTKGQSLQASAHRVNAVTRHSSSKSEPKRKKNNSDVSTDEEALTSDSSQPTRFKATKRKARRKDACFKCGRTGHWKSECQMAGNAFAVCDDCFESVEPDEHDYESDRELETVGLIVDDQSDTEPPSSSESEPEQIIINSAIINQIIAAQVEADPDIQDTWVFDTGSSVNITNSLRWFYRHRPVHVRFGTSNSQTSIIAEAVGSVRFRLRCGKTFYLDNVYYCPTARMNLMTNLHLRPEFSFTVTPTETIAHYKDRKTGRVCTFEFARVQRKQNVIQVQVGRRENAMAVLRSAARPEQRQQSPPTQQNRHGAETTQSSTPAIQREQPEVTEGVQRPARRGPGHPRKNQQSPPSEQRLVRSPVVDQLPPTTDPVSANADSAGAPGAEPSGHRPSETPAMVQESEPPDESADCSGQESGPESVSSSESNQESEKLRSKHAHEYPEKLLEQMEELGKRNNVKNGRQVHKLYGHIGQSATQEMSYLFGVPCPKFDCEPCSMDNLQHTVNTQPSFRKSTRPLEVVYMDICQPYKRSVAGYGGVKYSLIILDDFTGFSCVYNLKTKSEAEVFKNFEHFRTGAERRHSPLKLTELRTDNGREFVNESFKKLSEQLGFEHHFSVAHVHEMNGKIERLNQTIEKRCYKLIEHSGLSEYYWPLAMERAVQIFNNTANARSGVPYFNWYQHVDGHMLYSFGERVAYMYYDGHGQRQRGKGRIVGQDNDSRSYKVLPHGQTHVKGRVYFIRPLYRHPDSPLPPIVAGEQAEPNEADELAMYNEFAAALFESRERESERDPLDDCDEILDEFILQVIASAEHRPDGVRVPNRYSEIRQFEQNEQKFWYDCVETELKTLIEKNVLKAVPRAQAKSKPIGTQFVFTHKDGTGKARMVARGDRQESDTYSETYSPTMNVELLRLLLKIALETGRDVYTFDVKRAYLYSPLNEDVYIEVPEGYHVIDPTIDRRKFVLKLERALYGLKQSGRAWYEELGRTLSEFGFVPLQREPTLFVHPAREIIIAVYVDDLVVVVPSDDDLAFVRNALLSKYDLHENGLIGRVLGLNVELRSDGYFLHLTDMIDALCSKYNIVPNGRTWSPLPANEMIEPHSDGVPVDYYEYAALLGALLYIARMTRPDILTAVVQLCQFQSCPRNYHLRKLKSVLNYLANTRELGHLIRRGGSLDLSVYSDSSLANCHDRKSLMGSAVFLGRAMISFGSRKSRIVTLSSNEAEIVAALTSMKDLLYFKKLLCSLLHGGGSGTEPAHCDRCETPPMFVDNSGVISFCDRGFTRRTRYLDIEFYGLKGNSDNGQFELEYVRSADNYADMFTKNLNRETLECHRESVGIVAPRPAP